VFEDDAESGPRPANCVHAAFVEQKSKGASDFWMKGEATVDLFVVTHQVNDPAVVKEVCSTGPDGVRSPAYIDDPVRCCRSSAIRRPRHSITVITADPPKLTSGSGTPTTGARPMTIIRLIAT
jgi:hypothetical protein